MNAHSQYSRNVSAARGGVTNRTEVELTATPAIVVGLRGGDAVTGGKKHVLQCEALGMYMRYEHSSLIEDVYLDISKHQQ